MNLRDLLTAARAAGWQHEAHAGWLGREHTWTRGDTTIHLEDFVNPGGGGTYTELTITKGRGEIAKGRVESVDQALHLLATYGLADCPDRTRWLHTLAGTRAIAQAESEVIARQRKRMRALHAHGTPIGGV